MYTHYTCRFNKIIFLLDVNFNTILNTPLQHAQLLKNSASTNKHIFIKNNFTYNIYRKFVFILSQFKFNMQNAAHAITKFHTLG